MSLSSTEPPPPAPLPAVCSISLAWPLLAPASYQRWRVPALASLRLFLISMPVNFDSEFRAREV